MGDKRRLLEAELGNEFELNKQEYVGHSVEPKTDGMDLTTEDDDEAET